MSLQHPAPRWQRVALALPGLLLQAAAHASTLPAGIPFKQAPEDDGLVTRAITAFLLACAAAYGIAWLVKRYLPGAGKAGASRQLQRLEALRLTQRSTLLRVRWGDEELLLGENDHGVSLLGRRPASTSEEASGTPHATGEVPHD